MYTTDQEKCGEQYRSTSAQACTASILLQRSTFGAIEWPKRESGTTSLIIDDRAACRNLHRAAPTSTRSLFHFHDVAPTSGPGPADPFTQRKELKSTFVDVNAREAFN